MGAGQHGHCRGEDKRASGAHIWVLQTKAFLLEKHALDTGPNRSVLLLELFWASFFTFCGWVLGRCLLLIHLRRALLGHGQIVIDQPLAMEICGSCMRFDVGWLGFEHVFSRSEEHTSELQSQFHLVCRLLL